MSGFNNNNNNNNNNITQQVDGFVPQTRGFYDPVRDTALVHVPAPAQEARTAQRTGPDNQQESSFIQPLRGPGQQQQQPGSRTDSPSGAGEAGHAGTLPDFKAELAFWEKQNKEKLRAARLAQDERDARLRARRLQQRQAAHQNRINRIKGAQVKEPPSKAIGGPSGSQPKDGTQDSIARRIFKSGEYSSAYHRLRRTSKVTAS